MCSSDLASVDALMPHFERAAKQRDRGLDRLQNLRKYASPTPAMTAMLARVDALLDHRHSTSPALALADQIGVGPQKAFWFDAWIASTTLNRNGVPTYQGSVSVDSRDADWFRCSMSEVHVGGLRSRMTSFTAGKTYTDTLGLGSCTAEEMPAWLARAAKTLKLKLAPFEPRTNLRGKKRVRLVEWLTTGK